MSTGFKQFELEQTIISQANEITCLKVDIARLTGKFYETDEKYQDEKDRAGRYGGLIHTIDHITYDDELSCEEQITTIQTLINQWIKQEENYE